ncbi:MAG: acyltransferase family protein [Acidimicrobiales bacterium]
MALAGGLGTPVDVAQITDDVVPVPERAEGPPRLRHQPALDGLRGLAVAVVVAFHLDHLRGGFMGVDLFFVLSGYLITSLLLVEHGGRGAIALGRFWSRRARRLLPALFLLLAGVALLIATATPAGERPTLRAEALATLGYAANWQAMADDVGYWDMFARPSPLDHMWSLAIEEQFYVVWPLLVVGLLVLGGRARLAGPGVVAAASAAGAVASFVVLAGTYSSLDTSRAYYGTDARVGPTLLGAALAGVSAARLRREAALPAAPSAAGTPAATPGRCAPEPVTGASPGGGRGAGWAGPVAGLACLAVMGWAVVAIDGTGSLYYRGGLVAFALAAVLVVHVVTSGRGGFLAGALSARPLVGLGLISYGVYLWHWPVIVYLTPERAGFDGWRLDAACVAAALVLAVASYHLVERPVRRGALRGRTVRVALVGSVAAVGVAALVATNGVARVPGTEVALGTEGSGLTVYPETIPQGAERVLLVGDSGPTFLGPVLAERAQAVGAVAASDSQPFCTVLAPEGVARWADGQMLVREPCHDERRQAWSELVEDFDPDVVVYYLAAGGGAAELRYRGDWVTECDEEYGTYLRDALADDADVLAAGGATVALATTPQAPFVVTAPEASRAGLACRRTTLEAVAAERPGTAIVDMEAFLLEAEAGRDESMYRDLVHLSDLGAELVADWLLVVTREMRP